MYKLDLESINKLIEINNSLNQIEVKGYKNIGLLYGTMVSLQEILKKIESLNKDEPIIVDNTAKGG